MLLHPGPRPEMLCLFSFPFTITQHRYHHGALRTAPGNTTGLFYSISASTPMPSNNQAVASTIYRGLIMAEFDGHLVCSIALKEWSRPPV
jgi:hypothetical protein